MKGTRKDGSKLENGVKPSKFEGNPLKSVKTTRSQLLELLEAFSMKAREQEVIIEQQARTDFRPSLDRFRSILAVFWSLFGRFWPMSGFETQDSGGPRAGDDHLQGLEACRRPSKIGGAVGPAATAASLAARRGARGAGGASGAQERGLWGGASAETKGFEERFELDFSRNRRVLSLFFLFND